MKFKPLFLSLCVLFLVDTARSQSWSKYQSYSQKDVNLKQGTGDNFVDPGKNLVTPPVVQSTPDLLAESHRASYYPTYESASSNHIPQYNHGYYYRPSGDNRQGFDFGGTGGDDGGDGGGGGADGAGVGGLAGLAGALGLLGLKGVKGMATLAPLLLALPLLPLLPLLLPIIALPLLLPLLALLLFIPIPIVVTPGRSLAPNTISEVSERALRIGRLLPELTADVLQSEECVERLSCEVARISRNFQVDGWLDRLTSALPKENKFTKRILGGVYPDKEKEKSDTTSRKASSGDCSVFSCNAKSVVARYSTKI